MAAPRWSRRGYFLRCRLIYMIYICRCCHQGTSGEGIRRSILRYSNFKYEWLFYCPLTYLLACTYIQIQWAIHSLHKVIIHGQILRPTLGALDLVDMVVIYCDVDAFYPKHAMVYNQWSALSRGGLHQSQHQLSSRFRQLCQQR